MSVRKAIWGENFRAIEESLSGVDPDLYAYIRDFAYEEVLARPGLDLKTRELLAITSLIALGAPKEIATHLEGALRCGASEQEVREAIIQSAIFFGFPKALAAMKTFQALLRKRSGQP
ncbi:4-carboxymuconolactone decarboxylase [Meiothermus luteus]|jgi:4-carboxymuconolactone decarboxylase|uniref:4-carboxymuconolactone decarboxylase n=1 Tax=Meiothermus luteus TaxID=2026184 RepID=A0A399ETX6_9DEIN|nr:carboxymuconolactone decarboxylase family protein [Meiothermus luteus]RIH86539.1 4-carboxymuconolactone decarboxylase [Meiothermus luteus]RMH54361.1 MAG: carboxymuconolactone decarboxylase family protein [Deinococcota bacterium]